MLWWFAQTTLIAGALAVVATLAGRWKRLGPEARHALWLLVLIKLAIPPLVAWPWALPDAWPSRVEPTPSPVSVAAEVFVPPPSSTDAELTIAPALVSPPPAPVEQGDALEIMAEPAPTWAPLAADPAPDLGPIAAPIEPVAATPPPQVPDSPVSGAKPPPWDWNTPLLAAWLVGSVVVVCRRGVKVIRFHRALGEARPAPGWLAEEAGVIGERFGVRPPPVVATSRVATPLLWCLGRPLLVVPEALVKRLGVDRWPGILAHELAHLARGDHWVARLELLVEAAWWWNPLFWLARRRLHEEAEIACDARVVRALPERRYDYAEALVDVCEHIARSAHPSPSPALGVVGGGAAHTLEGRLHMILRDPIPRRPSRRAAALAALLAALALPAWTLGQQQPEAPSSKPDAPRAEGPPSKPDEATAAKPTPELPPPGSEPLVTIETIREARKQARQGIGSLSFRYIVAGQDQSRSYQGGGMGGMGGGMGGWGGMGGGMGRMGGGPGGPASGGTSVQPALTILRTRTVHVQVADVILGPGGMFRLDVLEAPTATAKGSRPDQALPISAPAWARRLVASDGSGYLTLEMAGGKTGPVPFRWLNKQGGQSSYYGDALVSAFHNDGRPGIDPDQRIDPLDPWPGVILELDDEVSTPFLDPDLAQVEVVGRDTIDGREVVRVAWTSKANDRLRGLCWFQGANLIRSDATMDPSPNGVTVRQSWRKRADNFVPVAGLWLPRNVTYEEIDNIGGEHSRRRERRITIEDHQVVPKPVPETFHPKLAIQDLDEQSGNFTANPPEIPAGLVGRLAKAVAESPFGPPRVERTTETPKTAATPAASAAKPGQADPNATKLVLPKPGEKLGDPATKPGQADFDIPLPSQASPNAPRRFLPKPGDKVEDPARADPAIIAPARPGFTDPIPTLDPKTNDPIAPKVAADQAGVYRRVDADPEVAAQAKQLMEARNKLDRQGTLNQPGDPAWAAAQRKLNQLNDRYRELREEKFRAILKDLGPVQAKARDELDVLQARREGKAAEVDKAKALRDLAANVVARDARLRANNANLVSKEEDEKAGGELAVAEAELASKKAALAEADARLNQASRLLEGPKGAGPAPDPLAEKGPKDAGGDVVADEDRGDVEVLQARHAGKAAELRKSEVALERAQLEQTYTEKLAAKGSISKQEVELYQLKSKLAEADVASKKADLDEADVLLDRARRASGRREASTSPSAPAATQADLRDAVELMEIQLQGKQAELRGVEATASLGHRNLEMVKGLAAKQGVSQKEVGIAEDRDRLAQAELDAKKAQVLEYEVRLKHAKRRLDANEVRLRRDLDRARARLDWSESMRKKGFVSQATYEADKSAYDELKIQLDPKSTPADALKP